ncbi:MAG: hypothetical protein JWO06_3484 [Bacteroidota bacterium]|nr:hypothetical protein [Bacteroidota bacterium]
MKKIFLMLGIVFAFNLLQAQDDDLPAPSSKPKTDETLLPGQHPLGKHRKDLSKYIIEPDFNFAVISGGISVGLSPNVGYNVWKGLYVGGGPTYIYTGYKNIGFTDVAGGTHYANAKWQTFGGGVFLQYNVWRGLFVRSRFEVLHRVLDDINNATVQLNAQGNGYDVAIPKVQRTIPNLLFGVGYNLLESKNFFFPLMISYNVLNSVTDKQYALYPKGWVFQLGFVNIF